MIAERQHRKLLVVDDEPLVRQTLSYCLEDEYDVVAVASGEEAIEASKKEAFPVVILDLCMEGISGIETLKHLKKIHESQNVIILTAYESTESAISALNLGAFNYLTKPFERKHLKEVISHGFAVYDQQSLRKQDMQHRLMSVHDSFFSLLCHEFNTPLNIILGYSELLQDNLKNPEHKAWVKDIKESGTHLHDILMEIVDYIGASHAATAGIHSPFVPEILLHTMIPTFHEKDVVVEIVTGPEMKCPLRGPGPSVLMIARKLVRMASHQSKRVRVNMSLLTGSEPHPARLRVAVAGTGLHKDVIRRNEIEQLFEPYQFMPSGEAGHRSSLGLELATCRKIAEYAQGTVECIFNARGELDFIAEIPVQSADLSHAE